VKKIERLLFTSATKERFFEDRNSIESVEVCQASTTTALKGICLLTASEMSFLARSSLDLKFFWFGVVIGR